MSQSVDTMFPGFRFSVNDVPTENWTMEELFQWTLMKGMIETEQTCRTRTQAIRQEFDQGIQQLQQECQQQQNDKSRQQKNEHQTENQNPNQAMSMQRQDEKPLAANTANNDVVVVETTQPARQPTKPKRQNNNHNHVWLQTTATTGEHAGKSFGSIKVTASQPVWVGRSRGRKFKEGKGISLFKDLEVSTTHGKFMFNKPPKDYNEQEDAEHAFLLFEDTGSTNGTKVLVPSSTEEGLYDEQDVVPYEPYPLYNGTIVVCGQSQLEIVLVDDP